MTCSKLAAWTYTTLLTALLSCPATAQKSAEKSAGISVPPATPTPAPPVALQNTAIPDSLSVDEAVRIGLARNPQTTAGVAGVASAVANYRSLTAFPSVQLSITRAQGTSTAPTLNGADSDTFFDVGDVVDTSGQRRFQAAGARAQLGATRYQLDETQLSLAQQIRDAYWSLVAAQALTRYSLESLQEAQHVNQLVRTQQEAGAAPKVDVIRSSIDVANAQQAYLTTQGAERAALAAFDLLLVRPPTAPVKLVGNIEAAATGKAPPLDLAALTKAALANRPLVKSAVELVHVADYTVKQTRASRFPDLSVDYERSLQQTSDTVLLSVHLPLFDFGNDRYAVKAVEGTRKQATAQKEQAEQTVVQQVAQAYQDMTQAQALLTSYLTDILTPSVTLRETAQLGYQQGATGILPLIDAETTLRAARTGYVNSLLAVYKAQDELNAALGTPAPK